MITLERVQEVLWAWDPAGISELREDIPREYDDLARAVVAPLQAGRPVAEVGIYLADRLREDWDVPIPPDDVVEQIRQLPLER